jgi:YD repeat-containing protein
VPTPTPSPGALPTATTGFSPWWQYVTGNIAGVGTWSVNVANANLAIISPDLDVQERGLDLQFARAFNSHSQHDYNNDDGSGPSNYGNGWTNSYDVHMGYNASKNVTSIYDETGTRWDYTPNGQGGFIPPSGQHATLVYNSSSCSYAWVFPDGTAYFFYSPVYAQCNSAQAAFSGRLSEIDARNANNKITFAYAFDGGDASTSSKLNQIIATHSDGHTLALHFSNFAAVGGGQHRLLSSVTWPDTQTVTSYWYDTNANLIEVDEPGSAGVTVRPQAYAYLNGQIYLSCSPRAVLSARSNGGTPKDGSCATFYVDASGVPEEIDTAAVVNFAPADGQNVALQSGPTGWVVSAQDYFTGFTNGSTEFNDDDGHDTLWHFDQSGRVVSASAHTGTGNLVTTQSWDSNNNKLSSTDPRGNETDIAYDLYGDIIAIAEPQITTNMGSLRPTALLSYDVRSVPLVKYGTPNVTAINPAATCDPNSVGSSGYNWTTRPVSDSLCSALNHTHYTWDYTDATNEPFGKLSDTYTSLGKHTHLTYSGISGSEGLATGATSDPFVQKDGTPITPGTTAQFDPHGNLTSLGNGNGTWAYGYDALNRLTTSIDPDNVESYRYYNSDNTLNLTESASQHANGKGTTYAYDADQNLVSEAGYIGGTYNTPGPPTLPTSASVTTRYYDGLDRLVEVALPYDSVNDVYSNPWVTRYIYDLSKGSTVTFSGSNIGAVHGNLYKMQELLPGSTYETWSGGSKIVNNYFIDVHGWQADALDRKTADYRVVNGQVAARTDAYDGAGKSGLLASECNAVNQCATTMIYDAASHLTSVQYNDANTPTKSLTYDPDGRILTATTSNLGTWMYAYDADGELASTQEPAASGLTSPTTLTMHYYPNGLRSSIDVNSSSFSQNSALAYSYRPDGETQTQAITVAANAKVGTTTRSFTFTNAGRFLTQTESGPGANAGTNSASYTNGLLSTRSAPGGSFATFEYDPQGLILGYSAQPTGGSAASNAFVYTTRGELASGSNGSGRAFAQGVPLALNSDGGSNTQWNTAMGVPIGDASGTYTYDLAGRRQRDPSGSTRTYDANDHLTSESYIGTSDALLLYTWGPSNHPVAVGSAFGSSLPTSDKVKFDTLHWDGDQVMFTSNAGGQLDDFKIGADADVLPNDSGYAGLTSFDRDITGNVAFCHNASGSNGTGAPDPYHGGRFVAQNTSPCQGTSMQSPTSLVWWGNPASTMPTKGVGTGAVLGMPGPDGIADDFNIIQGVRAYDPQLGTWETPDAYSGNIADPMSESSYTHDANNPANFKDSSGYDCTYWGTGLQHNPHRPDKGDVKLWCDDPFALSMITPQDRSQSNFGQPVHVVPCVENVGTGQIQCKGVKAGCKNVPVFVPAHTQTDVAEHGYSFTYNVPAQIIMSKTFAQQAADLNKATVALGAAAFASAFIPGVGGGIATVLGGSGIVTTAGSADATSHDAYDCTK